MELKHKVSMAPIKRLTCFWTSEVLTPGSLNFYLYRKGGLRAWVRGELEWKLSVSIHQHWPVMGKRRHPGQQIYLQLYAHSNQLLAAAWSLILGRCVITQWGKCHSQLLVPSMGMGQRSTHASHVHHPCTRTFQIRDKLWNEWSHSVADLNYQMEGSQFYVSPDFMWEPKDDTGRSWSTKVHSW